PFPYTTLFRSPVRAGTHDDRPFLQGQQVFSVLACLGNHHGGGEIWRTKANRGASSGPGRWKQERGSTVRRVARKPAGGPVAREQDSLSYVGLFLRRGSVPRLGDGVRPADARAEGGAERYAGRERRRHLGERHGTGRGRGWQRLYGHRQRHL